MQKSKSLACVKVKKERAEEVRRALKSANLLRTDVKIRHDANFVYLPLTEEHKAKEVVDMGVGSVELCRTEFEVLAIKPGIEELIGFKPSYEIVGDIAVLNESADEAVASAIMKLHKNIRVVARRRSHVEGVFRRRRIEIIAGERRTETVHKENGCRYKLDLERVYFNPRLATERNRVASLAARSASAETIIDMFAGVGPFSILIAKRAVKSHIIAIDINPDAIKYLRENIRLNAVENVEPIEGDVKAIYGAFRDKADRIIMNLPKSAYKFLAEAVQMLKPEGGTIHFYMVESIKKGEDMNNAKHKFCTWLTELGAHTPEILTVRKVKAYAPRRYIIGIDARVFREI